MKNEYDLQGKTEKLEVEVEEKVAHQLQEMADYMKFSSSEIVNTALKRFIANHKDFLPVEGRKF